MNIWTNLFNLMTADDKIQCPKCNRWMPRVFDPKSGENCKDCMEWEEYPKRNQESGPYE